MYMISIIRVCVLKLHGFRAAREYDGEAVSLSGDRFCCVRDYLRLWHLCSQQCPGKKPMRSAGSGDVAAPGALSMTSCPEAA